MLWLLRSTVGSMALFNVQVFDHFAYSIDLLDGSITLIFFYVVCTWIVHAGFYVIKCRPSSSLKDTLHLSLT